MSSIEKLKSEAIALRQTVRSAGRELKHCAALELVAKKHGYESWRACCAVLAAAEPAGTVPEKVETSTAEMKCYQSAEWSFSLKIPASWNSFPPSSRLGRNEVIRFASREDGVHLLIIYRWPHNRKDSLKDVSDRVQIYLVEKGFGNFSAAETTIGSRAARALNFDRPQENGTWSCRNYFINDGTLTHALAFGTNRRDAMFDLYDRMAKSFEILGARPTGQPS